MEKTDRFLLGLPKRDPIIFKEESFQPIDLGRNFFLAKTNLLVNSLYDEDRRMADHETSFWRWKEKGYKCFYYNKIRGEYRLNRPAEYDKMRSRFTQCKQSMMLKYGLKYWVSYSPELVKFWELGRR